MEWIKQIVQALVIVLLQVLLFDHLQIGGWGFPMVYDDIDELACTNTTLVRDVDRCGCGIGI